MCGGMVKMGLSFILVSLLLASVALTYSFSRVGGGVHLKAITLKRLGYSSSRTRFLGRLVNYYIVTQEKGNGTQTSHDNFMCGGMIKMGPPQKSRRNPEKKKASVLVRCFTLLFCHHSVQ